MAKGWKYIGSNGPAPYDHREKARKDFFNLMKLRRMPKNKNKYLHKIETIETTEDEN